MIGVGIDFGTSNSTVALYDGQRLRYLELEAESDSPEVMPTALYLDRELRSEIGGRAIARYLRENAGRRVELVREEVGELEVVVAGTDDTRGRAEDGGALREIFGVHAYTDHGLPGRLFRGVKRWLGNEALEKVRVFDASFRVVALITPVLVRMRQEAERVSGRRARAVHVGRPVHFEGRGADPNRVATARLAEACGYAGIEQPTLYPEPIAAALGFLHGREAREREVLLAFDFGGGTLDLTVLRRSGEEFEILATHGVGLGGNAIDRRVYERKIFPELGEGARVKRPLGNELHTVRFDFDRLKNGLLNWALAYELNRPELCEPISQGMRAGGATARKLARLHELITKNHAYRVFCAIERAKIELSGCDRADIDVPELDLSVPLARDEFEEMIKPLLEDVDAAVSGVLERARVPASYVDVVVRTGGSSKIPAVIRRLEARFPGRVVEHDPFTSIAAGLALASFHGYSA